MKPKGLTIQGQTPMKCEPYEATFIFDKDACLEKVCLVSNRGEGSFAARNLADIVKFIRNSKAPVALWRDSGDTDTLQHYLQSQRLPVLCGCLADLLEQMGLVSVLKGRPVRISAGST